MASQQHPNQCPCLALNYACFTAYEHGPFMYIAFMAVDPKHQGQGLGSLLLKRVCEDADEKGEYMLANKIYGPKAKSPLQLREACKDAVGKGGYLVLIGFMSRRPSAQGM
eukprot:scaffold104090_cov17-Tisochrysis_lutea.AAC.2